MARKKQDQGMSPEARLDALHDALPALEANFLFQKLKERFADWEVQAREDLQERLTDEQTHEKRGEIRAYEACKQACYTLFYTLEALYEAEQRERDARIAAEAEAAKQDRDLFGRTGKPLRPGYDREDEL